MAIQHINMPRTCLYGYRRTQLPGKYTRMSSYRCIHASHPLWKGIFYRIFLHVTIYEFSLHISMNCTENVAELLVYARTVDTRHSSRIFWAPGNKATIKLPMIWVHLKTQISNFSRNGVHIQLLHLLLMRGSLHHPMMLKKMTASGFLHCNSI